MLYRTSATHRAGSIRQHQVKILSSNGFQSGRVSYHAPQKCVSGEERGEGRDGNNDDLLERPFSGCCGREKESNSLVSHKASAKRYGAGAIMAEPKPNDEEPAESKEFSRFLVNRVSLDLSGTPDENGSLRSSSDLLIDSATYEYDTRYSKSLGQLTREVAPRADFYQDVNSVHHQYRPTMEELHEAKIAVKSMGKSDDEVGPQKKGKIIKFGWFEGVYMRCLLNIWGVMLFLRLSWVIGQAGLAEGLLVIILANVVTLITAVSMSAVSTNGQIKGGGIYYLISRSLGPEFGGAIGLMFTLANSIAVAMYIVGFCESVRDLVRTFGTHIIDDGPNDIRAVGLLTVAAILVLALIGMDWVTRMQLILLVVLVLSQVDFMLGTVMGPRTQLDTAKGFVGYKSEVFLNNMWASYRPDENGVQQDFFSVFAVFFPAVTGIVAGANLSGDLKDPSRAIPFGTLLAIVTTWLSYLVYAVMMGGTVLREASGNVTDLTPSDGGNSPTNISDILPDVLNATPWGQLNVCAYQKCSFGLLNDYQAMGLASAWGPLIYGGCFAATLSSAIASLVGAPRVLQALAKDRLYPLISIFGRGWGANNDPIHGYFLVFLISVGCILIAELNAIAPLLSNFFLAAYALINFSVFHATASKCPGWRPSFKYYNSWVSLIGCVLCVFVMFLISPWTALITLLVVVTLYLYVAYRKPDVNWGSSTQAQYYTNALKSAYALNRVEDHVKNFRPQLLVLCGPPCARPPMLDFANLITRGLSLLMVAQVLQGRHSQRYRRALSDRAAQWLHHHKVKAFFCLQEDDSFEHAVKSIIQSCGLGKLKPNVLLMGYKTDWRTCDAEELRQYFHVIHYALDQYMAVGILRLKGQMDFSDKLAEKQEESLNIDDEETLRRNQSAGQFSQADEADGDSESTGSTPSGSPHLPRTGISSDPGGSLPDSVRKDSGSNAGTNGSPGSIVLSALRRKRSRAAQLYQGQGGRPLSREIVNAITLFQRKQKRGFIDVWWLYDDGGLTLLLPHILNTRPQFSDCKLRIFSLANKRGELDRDQRNLAALLSKFRIDYSDVIVIPEITRKAQDTTRKEFEALLEGFRVRDSDDADIDHEVSVTDSELVALREKSNRHMRLREELLLHSKDSTFVVMTLPMPRKGTVSAPVYMAWLELLTRDMPPYLIVRGNQSSVLTFYS